MLNRRRQRIRERRLDGVGRPSEVPRVVVCPHGGNRVVIDKRDEVGRSSGCTICLSAFIS